MSAHLAVDFGARFADFVAWDDAGLRVVKLANSADMATVFAQGIAALQLDPAALRDIRLVSTAPLNALLARHPAKVALLTTQGFRDTLRLGRQNRVALYDPVAKSPAPDFLVAPDAIHEIAGRVDAQGAEVTALSDDDLDRAIAAIRASGADAVAVCFLFAHLNPDHERRAAQRLRTALPDVAISLSHVVDPAPREYDRTVSAVLDAWIAATSCAALAQFTAALPRGFVGDVLFGDSMGALVPATRADTHRAILLTGAPAAAARAAATPVGDRPTLAIDIGSQSADMTLIENGAPVTSDYTRLAGVDLRLPMVDMVSVALGGARRVRHGPTGLDFDATDPAAPSLDDALATLGQCPDGPTTAPLSVDQARAIRDAAAQTMALELTRYATRRNVDPARATLMVMGGTGPLLATAIAEALGVDTVSIPRAPAASGAIGLAQAPRRQEASRRIDRALVDLCDADLSKACAALKTQTPGEAAPVYTLTLAARAQMHPLRLTLADAPTRVDALRHALNDAYADRFGIAPPGPGHLFDIRLHRDHTDPLPPLPPNEDGPRDGPALIATEAGTIYLAQGWCLTPDDAAYTLTRNAR